MQSLLKRVASFALTLAIFSCMIPAIDAATGYDRGYTGTMKGTGTVCAKGVDVSEQQGSNFNFQAVKDEGYNYVILRCGTSERKDNCFDKFYTNAKIAGLDVGVYFYTTATTVAQANTDAQNCLSYIEGKEFEYPVYYDFEDPLQMNLYKSGLSQKICLAFMDKMATEGYLTGLLTMKSWMSQSWVKTSEISSKYEGWIADYSSGNDYNTNHSAYSTTYGMYQYYNDATIGGQNPLNVSVCYKDYPAIVKKYGFNGYLAGEWVKTDSGKWHYSYGDSFAVGWTVIDGETYYFEQNGDMHTGWFVDNYKRYYFNPSNGIMQRGWIKVSDKWYFMGNDGVATVGWMESTQYKVMFYFDIYGAMATGLTTINGNTYFFEDASGSTQGNMVTGWRIIDGNWYYFGSDGIMVKGNWVQAPDSDLWYYLGDDGIRSVGWIKDGVTTYYLNSAGEMVTGWQSIDGKWHHFSSTGVYYKSSVNIGKDFYARITTTMDASKALSVDGVNVEIRSEDNQKDQIWHFELQSDGSYKITNTSTNTCLDVLDGHSWGGANVQVCRDNGGTAQRWIITNDLETGYTLKPVCAINADTVLDVNNLSTADGTNVSLSPLNGGKNQQFYIEKTQGLGDVDDNGVVNANDVTAIQKIVAGMSKETQQILLSGDVNGNGKIDIRDATYVQLYIAKAIDSFPVS